MYDEQEDAAQLEWCRQWSEEHKKNDPEDAEEDQTGSALV